MRKKNNQNSINDGSPAAVDGEFTGKKSKPTGLRGRTTLALLMAATVGLSGCQTFRFPGNPFAGGRLSSAKLPLPKLPSFAKLPKPNFGNIARAVRTPSEQVIASNNTSIASAKRQPPPPPSRKFDSTSTDQQMAKSEKVSGGSGTKSAGSADTSGDFLTGARGNNSSTDVALTDAQKRFKDALSGKLSAKSDSPSDRQSDTATNSGAGLWRDYRPDPASSIAGSSSVQQVQDLAKVNRNLYDQYGKLNTGNSSSKLSEPLDAKMLAAKISQKEIDKTNQSVANLKQELERIKTRGSGSSDDFSLPVRSALEIAGSAAPVVRDDEPETPVYKGFGSKVTLSPSQENSNLANEGTVRIARSGSRVNVLRATPRQIPGLVPTIEIGGSDKYAATQFGRYETKGGSAKKSQSKDFQTPDASTVADDFQANQFVEKMNDQQIPTLTAKPSSKAFEMPLPREVSEASLAAIRENQKAAAAAPMPQVTHQNPIQQTPVAMTPMQSSFVPTAPVAPTSQSPLVGQVPQSTASAFQIPTTRTARIMNNPFYRPPSETSAPVGVADVQRVAELTETTIAEPAPVAEVKEVATDLPSSLITGDSAYSPGSVVRPQTDTSILR